MFKAFITSFPPAYSAEWGKEGKEKGTFERVDISDKAYRGTSDLLPSPILVVRENEVRENQRFQIRVTNTIGSNSKLVYGNFNT